MASQEDFCIRPCPFIPVRWPRELIIPIKFPYLDLIIKTARRRKPAVIRESNGVYFAAVGFDVQQCLSIMVPQKQLAFRVTGDYEIAVGRTVNGCKLTGGLLERPLAGITR